MVIRLKIDRQIVWPLLIIYMVKYFTYNHILVFGMALIWLICLMFNRHSFTITLPRVNGLFFYMITIVMSVLIGLFLNDSRDVIKDLYYVSQVIVIITIGYLYEGLNNGKSIKRTLYLAGTLMSLISIGTVCANIPNLSDLNSIRDLASNNTHEVSYIVAILLSDKIISKKIIFSKAQDWIFVGLMLLKILISMGRTELISTIGMVSLIVVLNILFSKNKWLDLIKILGILVISVVLIIGVYISLPEEAKEQFMNKMEYSFEEVDSDIEYDNYNEAIKHWRGFEIDQAQKQWKESDLLTQIFGGGSGRYIKVKYMPSEFTANMYKGKSIAILHNTYYTVLIKRGLVGVTALIWLYLSNMLAVFRKKYFKYRSELITLSAITMAVMFMSYIIMANHAGGMYIAWGIITGWTNALIRDYKR